MGPRPFPSVMASVTIDLHCKTLPLPLMLPLPLDARSVHSLRGSIQVPTKFSLFSNDFLLFPAFIVCLNAFVFLALSLQCVVVVSVLFAS